MSIKLQSFLEAPVIELETIDSTNNYAMRLIDADTAQPGLTIVSMSQTQGKGQRGKHWQDVPGQSLLMSLICLPGRFLDEQFAFNASVAIAVADALQQLYEHWDVRIKWPNDIIINDKKTGGILIENILRGNEWSYSIIGIGLNIHQSVFPAELFHASSLYLESGKLFDRKEIMHTMRKAILEKTILQEPAQKILSSYNDHLYRINNSQSFTDGTNEWKAIIKSAGSNGKLEVQLADGSILHYTHGEVQWKWS